MEKFKFFKENIEFLKEKIKFCQGFNKNIALYILKLLSCINFDNVDYDESKIELIDDEKRGGLFLLLKSVKDNLNIEISLFKSDIEMYVAEKAYPIYDSDTLKSSNIAKVKQSLKYWLTKSIFRETLNYKGNIKKDIYYYVIPNGRKHILHKSESLNYIFKKGERKVHKYDSWTKSEKTTV